MIRRSHIRFLLAALLIIPTAVFAQIGNVSGGGDSISWDITASGHERVELRITGPGDVEYTKSFANAHAARFSLRDLPGDDVEDGAYQWELHLVPKIPAGIAKQLASARAAGDEKAANKILKAAGIATNVAQSGTFTVSGGNIVPLGQTEGGSAARSVETDAAAGSKIGGITRRLDPVVQDTVIPDDLIVTGSACVGFDCVDGESFGFDTIRLKENNLRIKAEDTSTSAGFPTTDWQLTFNDSASGGANKFSVEDVTGVKVPLTITGGAPTNSVFVDSTGRVGFRTATPVLDLHVATSNTPAVRLEQNNSGGFTAQTWDVAGNEANFFVRDVTGGSRLPFRIRPGAPTSSLDIAASGNVGIGTASPSSFVHAFRNSNTQEFLQLENANTGADANATISGASDTAQFDVKVHAGARTISRFGKVLGGYSELTNITGNGVILGTTNSTPLVLGTNGTNRLEIAAAGGVTITGNLTVTGTKAFAQVDPADSSKALHYIALEGPEAGTYYRGSARTVNGEVVIELPGYFSRITESEKMTVQLTPNGKWGQMYVASKSPERIVVKVVEGTEDIEFDYFVQGIRKGYMDFQVERENTLPK